MEIEVLGAPKTVRLCTVAPDGRRVDAPMEIFLAAVIASLTPEHKAKVFELVDKMKMQRELQKSDIARVVADIPMPHV